MMNRPCDKTVGVDRTRLGIRDVLVRGMADSTASHRLHTDRFGASAKSLASFVAAAIRRLGFEIFTFALVALTLWAMGSLAHGQSSPTAGVMPEGKPVEIVAGLTIPWSAVPVGDEVLVSQRGSAHIAAFRPGETLRSIGIVPEVVARGDGGMLGLAVLTEGEQMWVYAYHSTTAGNRIVRLPYSEGVLGDSQIVLDRLPGGQGHNGGRIAFGPDGMLYATVGETRVPELSQDRTSLAGKILRMKPDGGVPDDNPFRGSLIYSLGHRNPQGLAWDQNGQLWATEFGAETWDEFNKIEPGGNYGWPIVEGRGGNAAYIDPVMQWRNHEMGPSGLAYIDGTFFIAGLTGERLWSVTLDSSSNPTASEYYNNDYGRIRHVFEGKATASCGS
ncbi:PQQ-dependent sugar dehydrogenase [Rhizobium leguminosarum]|uniref:PQQ-dependent sugar dehydrogenase n=1 Tax=Rhizobium leguminosarum TaxID=384 RepID=UPI001C977956|nr:PQQ-dependent sugar dehydrogenase [Rhizobium leguminosarum]MBY5775208.1 PQQ-dependent sugar dehydrogenase [Rhizobium leguminosarum]